MRGQPPQSAPGRRLPPARVFLTDCSSIGRGLFQDGSLPSSPGHAIRELSGGRVHIDDRSALCGAEPPRALFAPPRGVDAREAHVSWVFLAGELVYKLKKPLVLGFLDYGTPERRRAMCEEEVRLNRRLAPDIYLGVKGVALANGAAELTAAEDPRAVEFVVEMRRYDERRTLAARLRRGELGHGQVGAVGRALALPCQRAAGG